MSGLSHTGIAGTTNHSGPVPLTIRYNTSSTSSYGDQNNNHGDYEPIGIIPGIFAIILPGVFCVVHFCVAVTKLIVEPIYWLILWSSGTQVVGTVKRIMFVRNRRNPESYYKAQFHYSLKADQNLPYSMVIVTMSLQSTDHNIFRNLREEDTLPLRVWDRSPGIMMPEAKFSGANWIAVTLLAVICVLPMSIMAFALWYFIAFFILPLIMNDFWGVDEITSQYYIRVGFEFLFPIVLWWGFVIAVRPDDIQYELNNSNEEDLKRILDDTENMPSLAEVELCNLEKELKSLNRENQTKHGIV